MASQSIQSPLEANEDCHGEVAIHRDEAGRVSATNGAANYALARRGARALLGWPCLAIANTHAELDQAGGMDAAGKPS